MAGPITTNFSWQLPEEFADVDQWGDILNDLFIQIDADLALHAKLDGTTSWTGDWDANGNKLTGLDAATVAGDAVRFEQVEITKTIEAVDISATDDLMLISSGGAWVGINMASLLTTLGAQAQNDALDDISGITPAKGQLIVDDGTNFDALGVGTNGQVLTADSGESLGMKWDDLPEANEKRVRLGEVTIAADASIDLGSAAAEGIAMDESLYDFFEIDLINVIPSLNTQYHVRTSSDDGANYDQTAGNYRQAAQGIHSNNNSSNNTSNNATSINITNTAAGNDTGEDGASGRIRIWGPGNNKRKVIEYRIGHFASNGFFEMVNGFGSVEIADIINGVQIYPASGTFLTGKIVVWGIKNS